jgi:endonuclease YncB( thermonuclease family)
MDRFFRELSLIFILVAALAGYSPAQIRSHGEVVELIDGKTVVVAIHTGRITVEMQYIDVPEPSQELHAVIKQHVGGMLMGKAVELQTNTLVRTKAIGKVTLDGVDVSRQLLRDGAAWHVPIELSGQNRQEFEAYAASEALARTEKRGIWSVPALRAPWEIRAEYEQTRREAEAAQRRQNPIPVGVTPFHTDTRKRNSTSAPLGQRSQMDMWVDTLAFAKNEGYGLHVYKDPNGRYQAVYSSPIMIDLNSAAGKEKLECRMMYVTGTRNDGAPVKTYIIGFRAISADYRFSKVKTSLTAIVDGKVLPLGPLMGGLRGQGMIGGGGVASGEIMFFSTNKAALNKIANARKVEFRINKFSGVLPVEARDLFRQVLAAGS